MNYQFIISLKEKVSGPAKQMKQSLGAVVTKVDTLKDKFDSPKGLTGAVHKVKNSLGGLPALVAGAFAVGKIVSFGGAVVDTLAQFEKMESVLTNTLGSKSAAQAALSQIKNFAATTPFQVDELSESFVKLANQNFKPTMAEMTALGDLASSTGKSFDQLTEAFLDAGQGEFERLKEFGIKAKKQGDLVRFTFKGQTTEVKNSDKAIQQYLLSLGKAQGVQGAMAAISETTGGKLSNLSDKFTNLKLTIGEKLQPVIHQGIAALSSMIDRLQKMVSWVSANSDTILTLGAAALKLTATVFGLIASVKIAVFAFKTAKIIMLTAIGVYKGFVAILTIVRNAQLLFNLAMLANPIGLVIAAVVALGAALYILVQHWDSIKAAVLRVTEPLVNLVSFIFPNLTKGLSFLVDGFKWAFEKIANFIKPVTDKISWVVNNIKSLVGSSIELAKGGIEVKAPQEESKPFNPFDPSGNLKVGAAALASQTRGIKQNSTTSFNPSPSAAKNKTAMGSIVGTQRPVTNYKISIGKLVENMSFHTTNLKESSQKVEQEITKALMKSVNNFNHGT